MLKKGDYALNPNNYPGLILTEPDENGFVEFSGYTLQKHNVKYLRKLVPHSESEVTRWAIKNNEGKYLRFDSRYLHSLPVDQADFFESKEKCQQVIDYYYSPEWILEHDGHNPLTCYAPFEFVEVKIGIV